MGINLPFLMIRSWFYRLIPRERYGIVARYRIVKNIPKNRTKDEYQSIPLNKIEDFGVHCKSYYSLETSIFKSQTDNLLLKTLWNKYWASTLSSSTLKTYVSDQKMTILIINYHFSNEDYITEQIKDISGKLEHVSDQVSRI